MFGKSAWLAGALAAGLLTASAAPAAADGGYGWKHGGHHKHSYNYHHNRHLKHFRHHHGGKHFHRHKRKHYRHKKHGHFKGRGYKHYRHFRYGGRRHFRHHGPRYYQPYGFTFFFRLGHSYDEYAGPGYDPGSRVVLLEERTVVAETLEHAPDQQGITWDEPRSQASYEVVPTESYREPGGRYCREFLTTARVGGQVQEAYGQACRQPDGSWEIVR